MKYIFIEDDPTCIFLNTTASEQDCSEHVKTSQTPTALMYCNSKSSVNVFSLQDLNEIGRDIEIPAI